MPAGARDAEPDAWRPLRHVPVWRHSITFADAGSTAANPLQSPTHTPSDRAPPVVTVNIYYDDDADLSIIQGRKVA